MIAIIGQTIGFFALDCGRYKNRRFTMHNPAKIVDIAFAAMWESLCLGR